MRPESYLDLFDSLAQAPVTVWPERCVLVRNRHATCGRCAEACTSGCISFDGGRVVVDPDLCVGCATCATVCPTGALEPQEPSDRQLYEACARSMAKGRVALACERSACDETPGSGVVRLGCLGRVDESLIALLARAGARDIELVHGRCEDCRERPGRAVAEQACSTANALFEAWGQRPMVRMVASAVETGGEGGVTVVESRTHGGDEEVRTGVAVPPQRVKDDGTLPHMLPNRRRRLLQALDDAFGEPDPQTPVQTRLWGRVSVDTDSCRSCLACAVFCPTEALHKVQREDGSVVLQHYPSRCVKCGCCSDVCPTGAVVLHDEVFAGDLHPGACECYELPARPRARGPHQMRDAMASLLGCDFIYER